jgi:hypothetical protein
MSRPHVRRRPWLGRAGRLSAVLGLGVAAVASALALPAAAVPAHANEERGVSWLAAPAAAVTGTAGRTVHTVTGGETLSGIAKAAKLPGWQPIWDVNPIITNPNLIQPGWKLTVPAKGEATSHRPLPVVQPVDLRGERAAAPRRRVAPARRPAAPPRPPTVAGNTVWDRLAACESGGNWSSNTGNGFSGGLQFSPGTWRANGGAGSASSASRAQQIAVAQRVLASQGWGAWPACSARLGLR